MMKKPMGDRQWMDIALFEAKQAALRDEVPVGAVLVMNGEIIAQGGNRMEELFDPTAHAEVLVIREATQKLKQTRLDGAQLYVTLEPCPLCATAISFARIETLYFGAYDPKGGGVDHGPHIYNHSTCHHKPAVYGGIAEQESGDLLRTYFKKLRD